MAYWKVDEAQGTVAADSAGENDATVLGGAVWWPGVGQVKRALLFDGKDDYISAPAVLDPSNGPFSVFLWIKGGAPGQVLLSQVDGANWLRAAPANGTLQTELNGPGRNAGKHLTSPVVITDDAWHRVGLVWSGANRALYVDDVEVARETLAKLPDVNSGLYLGTGSKREKGSFWSGLIDDVRIYNRVVGP